MADPIRPAIIGKHPDYGDFIRHGLSPDVAEKLMRWMDTTLARVKTAAGDDWEAFWDGAQACRFWLGRDVLGATAIGVMLPSHDRVGRRYPLLTLAMGVDIAPPFQDPADDVMERIEQHLNHARGGGPGGAGALLEALDLSDLPAEGSKPDRVLWAHHPDGDLDRLLERAARVDHALCATNRSYWWAPARGWRTATWLGCDGLPGHEALSWLLSGEAAASQPMQHPAAPAQPAPFEADGGPQVIAYANADFDPFAGPPADPLPDLTRPPQSLDVDDTPWEDDDLPRPTGDALPDIGLPDTMPQEDARAALLGRVAGEGDLQTESDSTAPPGRDAP